MNAKYRRIRTALGVRYAHRAAKEVELGRPLDRSEIVHHENRDKEDNRPVNLAVTSRPEHTRLHIREDGHPMAGKPVPQERRARISLKLKGRALPASTRAKMAAARTGKRWAAEPERRARGAEHAKATIAVTLSVNRAQVEALRAAGWEWKQIAAEIGVSCLTLQRRRAQWRRE